MLKHLVFFKFKPEAAEGVITSYSIHYTKLYEHPYEEVAYDLIPLANRRSDVGLGRIGRLARPVALEEFAGQVKELLGGSALRLVGDAGRKVTKVALCGGSGSSSYNFV